MNKKVVIFFILISLGLGFFIGKSKTHETHKTDEVHALIEQIQDDPSPELYEKLFLLLLAQIGLKNIDFKLPAPKTKIEVREKIVEVIKTKESKCISTYIEKKCPEKKKDSENILHSQLMQIKNLNSYNKKIKEIYKNSYVLVKPFDHQFKGVTFDIRRKNYDSQSYILEVDSKMNHNGKMWNGPVTVSLISSERGTIDSLKTEGSNTKIYLAPTKPESLIIELKDYIVHIPYSNGKLHSGAIYRMREDSLIPWGILRKR